MTHTTDHPGWDAPPRPDITDPETRRPRLCSEECATCIFRPGNLMHLARGGLHNLVSDTLRRDTFIVCHSTLPGMAPEGFTPAACHGFYTRYSTNPLRIYDRLQAWLKVPPPEKGRVMPIDHTQAQLPQDNKDRLLTPGEVAKKFRVDPKTVTRWASAGRIASIRTPGGHRRFRESDVTALLNAGWTDTP